MAVCRLWYVDRRWLQTPRTVSDFRSRVRPCPMMDQAMRGTVQAKLQVYVARDNQPAAASWNIRCVSHRGHLAKHDGWTRRASQKKPSFHRVIRQWGAPAPRSWIARPVRCRNANPYEMRYRRLRWVSLNQQPRCRAAVSDYSSKREGLKNRNFLAARRWPQRTSQRKGGT